MRACVGSRAENIGDPSVIYDAGARGWYCAAKADKNHDWHEYIYLRYFSYTCSNPALAEVFVLYENVGDDDCKGMGSSVTFIYMLAVKCTRTRVALRKRLESGLAKANLRMRAQFSCYHRATQPSYREMFHYASDQPNAKFKGSVVVLANGARDKQGLQNLSA